MENLRNNPSPETLPVADVQIEKTVLGTMMMHYAAITENLDILSEDIFHDPQNREVFRAIMRLYHQGSVPDPMLVSSELQKAKSDVSVLGLAEITQSASLLGAVREHVLLLQDYSMRRKLWVAGHKILADVFDRSVPVENIQASAKASIDSIYESVTPDVSTLKESYSDLQQHIIGNMDGEQGLTGTPTGFEQLDSRGGLQGGDLIVIGAETSQGKTSFATALGISAIINGHGVAFYSMEMTTLQLTARIASMRSEISSSAILNGRLDTDTLYHIDHAMEGINADLMFFDERSHSTLESISASIRTLHLKHGIKGAVVDYLQLINTKGLGETKEQAIATCARELKNLAKELGIWIIAISQLNRNTQSPLPSLSRLRDSGQIAEAADLILLIYRPLDDSARYPSPYSDVPGQGTAMVTIAKGRNIGIGSFICGFKSENTLFYPLSEPQLNSLRAIAGFRSTDPFEDIL